MQSSKYQSNNSNSTIKLKNIHVGFIYAFVHFALEVGCFQYLYMLFKDNYIWWFAVLLYDILAFMPQSIVGVFCDKHQKFRVGTIGGILMIASLLMAFMKLPVLWWIGLIVMAIGNACIHISGAIATLTVAEGKMSHSAIFVAGGSFGVITGRLLGVSHVSILISIALLVIAIVFMRITDKYWIVTNEPGSIRKSCKFDISSDKSFKLVIFMAFFVVMVRSFIASGIPLSWNETKVQTILLFSCMGIGKALGGILSDKFGARNIAMTSSCISLPFLLFGNNAMYISLIGITLFSMTMPITLGILISKLNRVPGLAFGITTIGLLFGTIPTFFIRISNQMVNGIVISILTMTAVIALNISLKKREEKHGRFNIIRHRQFASTEQSI